MPLRIALTGGPCAEKSTIRRWLVTSQNHIASLEAPTLLFNAGHPRPGKDLLWTPEWQRDFQCKVLPLLQRLENQALQIAAWLRSQVVWYDRGIHDLASYWPDQYGDFYEHFGLNRQDCLSRYDLVLHFESLACKGFKRYRQHKGNNDGRFETVYQAKLADRRIKCAWEGHPQRVIVPAMLSLTLKAKMAWREMNKYMALKRLRQVL